MFALQSVRRRSQVWSDLFVHIQTSDRHCGLHLLTSGLFIISHLTTNTQMHWNNHLVYSCKEGEIFSLKLSWYLSCDVCGMPFALIFNWISILALSSIYSTFIHCSALILMNLNSIIRDIVIEYRGTTYDNFYPDVSFCTLRSWASESTGSMCCESTASVFSKLDFTHYPSCVTFTCHACCSAPPRLWLQ